MQNLGGKQSALWGIGKGECTGHVVLSGTPEHRNITEHSGTTEKPGTPRKNQEHSQENPEHPKKTWNTPKKTRNTPEKARNTPRKSGTPRKKKQMAHQYVTACVSFSKLAPLIAHKIIWFDLHNLENIYKRHTGTIFFSGFPVRNVPVNDHE